MAPLTELALQRRGRWLYELGRARLAARILLLILPLGIAAELIGRPRELVFGLGGALAVLAFGLAMRHDRYARAARIGILAGLPAFALPLLIRSLGIVRLGEAALDPCLPASFLSGVLAGVVVSMRAVDEKQHLSFWLAAVATTALTGTLGCSVAGSAGVLGLMAGVVAGTTPVVLRTALRRS
jgi:hypothetical protein